MSGERGRPLWLEPGARGKPRMTLDPRLTNHVHIATGTLYELWSAQTSPTARSVNNPSFLFAVILPHDHSAGLQPDAVTGGRRDHFRGKWLIVGHGENSRAVAFSNGNRKE